MGKVLHVLIVEDSEDDTYLLARFLRRNGYEVVYERVDTGEAMQSALKARSWDLIISDYQMPGFSGLDAVKIARDSGLDLPFIILSGVIGEETAVAAMRAGAHDYLMKDNLARLIPAVERELHDAAERRARKQAESRVYQLSRALEQSSNLILVTAPDGVIEYLNPSFCHVTGYEAETLLGKPIDQWPPASDPISEATSFSGLVQAGLSWRGEVELFKKNDERYWALAAVTPIRDETGLTTGYIIVQEDITNRKQLEVELRHYTTHLEQIVAERTAELAQTNQKLRREILERRQAQAEATEARDQAVAALRLKTQLLANLNHEIRTPLSVINIKVNLLSRGYYGPISEQQNTALMAIYDEAQTLLTLMENLLEVSKLEADPTSFQPTWLSPSDLIDQVFSKLKPSAQTKGLLLTHDIADNLPEVIWGDPNQLQRILFNLVDNAIKFTDKGEVSVRLYRTDAQHWVIQVTDTGTGITASTQPHIFEPFWRADHSSANQVVRGVGLGLTVVQKLVHLMKGEIQVTSDGQSGTTFAVTLPMEYTS